MSTSILVPHASIDVILLDDSTFSYNPKLPRGLFLTAIFVGFVLVALTLISYIFLFRKV